MTHEYFAYLKPEALRTFGHEEIGMFAIRAKAPCFTEKLCHYFNEEAFAIFL